MYQLSNQDFDNIFAFYTEINSDFSNYENNVLAAFASVFNMRLTTYATCKTDISGKTIVDSMISNSIRKEIIAQYIDELYLEDPFLRNYSQLCYTHPAASFFSDDQLPEDYRSTGYAKLLNQYNIAYEANIGVNGSSSSLIHLIKVYKAKDMGGFTEHEKALFQYIGQVFNQSKILYSQFVLRQRELEAVTACCDHISFGFAVLDGKWRLIHSNSVFMSYSSVLSSSVSKEEVIKDVISAVTGTRETPDDNFFRKEAHIDGFIVTLLKKRATLSYRTENLHFITIQKEKSEREINLDTTALAAVYSLTRRETEVMLLVAKGYNNQEIADELYIGLTTVKTHIGNIYGKLSVGSRTELMKKLRNDEFRR